MCCGCFPCKEEVTFKFNAFWTFARKYARKAWQEVCIPSETASGEPLTFAQWWKVNGDQQAADAVGFSDLEQEAMKKFVKAAWDVAVATTA